MIEFRNITKVYRNGDVETPVLKGVSFVIHDGDFVAIMGPSGSGKSTLMNILGCLDTATGGDYVLDGRNVSGLSDDELADLRSRKIGFVFQSFNLLSRATVLRNVMLPLLYGGISREDRWLHNSNQLSGGQMQRVAIARALVNDPSLILADEPTGNLDTKTGEVVLETFQMLNENEHRTIVLITHEQYVAEHADRIVHIQDGLILEDKKNSKKRLASHSQP
jgi:putative ABC transport system ATP-binding protein